MNDIIEKNDFLSEEDKNKFKYFGKNSKIYPPFRILNPSCIHIGDNVSIREGAFIHAYKDLSMLKNYIEDEYKDCFDDSEYKYNPSIKIGDGTQIGRFVLISCTNSIEIGNNVVFSERCFIGDNNHTFSHPDIPIMFQPNKVGGGL